MDDVFIDAVGEKVVADGATRTEKSEVKNFQKLSWVSLFRSM